MPANTHAHMLFLFIMRTDLIISGVSSIFSFFSLNFCSIKITFRRFDNDIRFLILFVVTIESTGALPPEVLFTEAVKILEDKCERVITELS